MENTLPGTVPHRLDDTIRNDDTLSLNCYTPTVHDIIAILINIELFIELNKTIHKPKRDECFTTCYLLDCHMHAE